MSGARLLLCHILCRVEIAALAIAGRRAHSWPVSVFRECWGQLGQSAAVAAAAAAAANRPTAEGRRPSGISFYRQTATKCSCSAPGAACATGQSYLYPHRCRCIELSVCLGRIPRSLKKAAVLEKPKYRLLVGAHSLERTQVFSLLLLLKDLNKVVRE